MTAPPSVAASGEPDSVVRVPHGVVDEVLHDASELVRVAADPHGRARHLDVDPGMVNEADPLDHVVEVDVQVTAGGDRLRGPGQHEQVVDEPLHLLVRGVQHGRGGEPVGVLGVPDRDVELGARGGQRAPELVTGIRDEADLRLLGVVQPVEHAVERHREARDLVTGRRYGDAGAQVRLADLGGPGADLLDRPQRATGEQVGDHADDEHEQRDADEHGLSGIGHGIGLGGQCRRVALE